MTQLTLNGLAYQAQRTIEYILNTRGAFDLCQLRAGASFVVGAV